MDSDLDVAVYFFPSTGILELEEEIYYETEKEIWGDIDRLRNILAHEYLDIRYKFIESFLKDANPLYRDFCLAVIRYAALP